MNYLNTVYRLFEIANINNPIASTYEILFLDYQQCTGLCRRTSTLDINHFSVLFDA